MKFVLSSRTELQHNYWILKFTARYDENIPEDKKFNEYTPSGSIEMTVKDSVAKEYELGKPYYFYSDEVRSKEN